MALPKRKNDIKIYKDSQLLERRQELLKNITKSDAYLPDSILHDDLDLGLLDFIKTNFKVISDGTQIPVIPKILTIQRWGEITQNWTFSDEDGNMKVPFIGIIRKPDVQPGTNPSIVRTIPDRMNFHYASVATWNGNQMGADIYKMPQPVPVDITYEVTIVCSKFRDLNRFNKIVLQKFASRQAYTIVKGHYIPIVLDKIEDNSPIDQIDNRRFYLQNYQFTVLGFLIDSDEFEIKPAVSRMFLINEFVKDKNYSKKFINKTIDITVASFIADGMQTSFSVGESIAFLFNVTINGLLQQKDVDYYHIAGTSKITFVSPPFEGSIITITYYKGRNSVFIDSYGKPVFISNEYFVYDGSTLTFTVQNLIDSVISFDVNGLIEDEGVGYNITGQSEITMTTAPVIGSKIGIVYLY